jgi:hypothetical protein
VNSASDRHEERACVRRIDQREGSDIEPADKWHGEGDDRERGGDREQQCDGNAALECLSETRPDERQARGDRGTPRRTLPDWFGHPAGA